MIITDPLEWPHPPAVDRWRVVRGDCLDPATGLWSLEARSVDVVICDPPYSEHTHRAQRIGRTKIETGGFSRNRDLGFEHLTVAVQRAAADHFGRLARRWVLVFSDEEGTAGWIQALRYAGLEYVRTGIWVKQDATPQFTGDRPAQGHEPIIIAHVPGRKRWNGGGRHGVWTFPIVHGRDRRHTTEKPLGLMEALIRDFTEPDDLVLDPFAGSGTTGVAALRHGRRFAGWERDQKWAEVAMGRLAATREQFALPLVERSTRSAQLGFDLFQPPNRSARPRPTQGTEAERTTRRYRRRWRPPRWHHPEIPRRLGSGWNWLSASTALEAARHRVPGLDDDGYPVSRQ